MRKQTKLVAVLSAAALLAMGASMTSFAAGWEKDDAGVWHYYDKDDEMVAGEWRKDGAKWFYLDDDGDMLYDSWVDDDYYVGSDGAMLINQWIKTTADEDVQDPDDDGDAWYYFGSKGKKVTSDSKKINVRSVYNQQLHFCFSFLSFHFVFYLLSAHISFIICSKVLSETSTATSAQASYTGALSSSNARIFSFGFSTCKRGLVVSDFNLS